MALPNPFQKLKHGALLCKKNFNTFVETFNFLVDFAQNLRGDGDANGSGSIVFDRSVPDRPVIRSKINMDYPFGGGGEQKAIKFTGTDDSQVQLGEGDETLDIEFASASDSNVVASVDGVEETEQGSGVYKKMSVTIGVYYT